MQLKYRKKPVVVEAFQMTPERRIDNRDWPSWLNEAWNLGRGECGSLYPTVEGAGGGTVSIATLEGEHLVSFGDWIIRGIKGELYPCKPDIFDATYTAATDQPAAPADPIGPLSPDRPQVDSARRVIYRAISMETDGVDVEYVCGYLRAALDVAHELLSHA